MPRLLSPWGSPYGCPGTRFAINGSVGDLHWINQVAGNGYYLKLVGPVPSVLLSSSELSLTRESTPAVGRVPIYEESKAAADSKEWSYYIARRGAAVDDFFARLA